jgi:hypothetical protein
MTEKAEHALVVKTHWKTGAARLREQLRTSQQEAEKKAAEPRDVFAQRAGIEAFVARAALDLVDEVLQAAEAAEDALPIRLQLGQHLVLEGKVLRVINAWQETEATDGRTRWGIVTEGEEQPAAPADATAPEASCKKCGRTFVDDGKFVDSAARYADFPYCRTCVDRCHDTEIADHWCEIDQHRQERQAAPVLPSEAELADRIFGAGTAETLGTKARYVERPSGPPVRIVDGPACMPAAVPNESGELVRAGSLYSDKCAECTTGVSCEDAGRCLFEG